MESKSYQTAAATGSRHPEEEYDCILIGSGIGPLAAAATLAKKRGWKCLLLERHFRAGGFTHAFERKGYSWDVGIHYLGGMKPGESLYQLFQYLGDGSLSWQTMPHEFDIFEYPDLVLRVPAAEEEYRERLQSLFPAESRAIARYFIDIKKASAFLQYYVMSRLLPGPFGLALRGVEAFKARFALQTTEAYLHSHFRDEKLRALLASQWGDYGLPPAQSAFAIHSIIATHYLQGGWYPAGGGSSLLESLRPTIEKTGGMVAVNHEAQEILLDDRGRACGVRARAGQGRHAEVREFRAPVIISGAGALSTYGKLLRQPPDFLPELQALPAGGSALTLYLGLKESPAGMGFQGENYWMYAGFDHNRTAAADIEKDGPQMAFLSFPSLKDPRARKHTAEIIHIASYEPFARYVTLPWRNRGPEYEEKKARLAEQMLAFVEKRHPGFAALVDYQELSTPATVEHFTAFPRGSIYGLPATPERYRKRWLGPRTPIPGLYLTGADVASLGIGGALFGGIFTASVILGGAAFPTIMKEAMTA